MSPKPTQPTSSSSTSSLSHSLTSSLPSRSSAPSTQNSTPSSTPTPIPAQAPSPASPLDQVAHLSIPAASVLARFQVAFTAIVEELDPSDPKLRPWFEQYAMLQQAALCERLYNLFEQNFNGGSEEVKFIRLLLQALTVQEKTAARRDRNRARKQREAGKQARDKAKQAKDQQRLLNARQAIDKAKETLDCHSNLNHAGTQPSSSELSAPNSALPGQDASVPAENENPESTVPPSISVLSTQNSVLPSQDATTPAKIENIPLTSALTAS